MNFWGRSEIEHPWFARFYIWGQDGLERAVGDLRKYQNQRALGRTLIVGAGTGLDIPQLGLGVTEAVLNEPEPTLRAYLHSRYPNMSILSTPGESLDTGDQEFDTVLSSFVLCSVNRIDDVLKEIFRVLKPGGQYLFLEHVRHHVPMFTVMQDVLNPMWKPLGGGCHLNRDVYSALTRSPLALVEYTLVRPGFLLPIVNGRAVRPLDKTPQR